MLQDELGLRLLDEAAGQFVVVVLDGLAGVGFALAAATNREFPMRRRLIGIAVVGLLFILYVHLAVGIVDWLPLAGS